METNVFPLGKGKLILPAYWKLEIPVFPVSATVQTLKKIFYWTIFITLY